MIKPGEIQKKARLIGVRDQQIEKDYILSWILQGVAIHEDLSKIYGLNLDFYTNEFIAKCESKNIDPKNFSKKLEQRLPQYNARWQKSMKEQIQNLPEFEKVERELKRHFRKLFKSI